MENHENVLYGISQVMKYVGIDKALIGIEDNKPEAIKLMQEKTAQMSNVEVVTLPSRYPQGAEKVLIEQCTGRQVPPGKLPSDGMHRYERCICRFPRRLSEEWYSFDNKACHC